MSRFTNLQGVINGQISRLFNKPDELKEFMKDKTDEQKRQGKIHYQMIKRLRGKE